MRSLRTTGPTLLALLIASACAATGPEPSPFDTFGTNLSRTQRRERAARIRDAAAAHGLTNGWVLASIADAETNLAHCWSEATWACRGPHSADCGGPVIAGAGDGACSLREGGLGMFQFDGGDHDATLRRDGEAILTIDGSIARAVEFVIDMVIRSRFTPASTRTEALSWMNALRAGGPGYHEWIQTVTGYYNGCLPDRCSVYESRYARYDEKHRALLAEMGEDFWFGAAVPTCGDGSCDGGEDCASCSADCGACGPSCGDGSCDAGEDCASCSADCGACAAACGDGWCDAGEDCGSCSADCGACGPSCGDGVCQSAEDCGSCSADCGSCGPSCGDGWCDATEDCGSCSADCGSCGPSCGDGWCDPTEDCASCSADCGSCGPSCSVSGHLGTGETGDPCSQPEAWRCAYSEYYGEWGSQVCRGGQWLIYHLSPRDCASCCGSYGLACER